MVALLQVSIALEAEAFEQTKRAIVAGIGVRFEAMQAQRVEGKPDERGNRFTPEAPPPMRLAEREEGRYPVFTIDNCGTAAEALGSIRGKLADQRAELDAWEELGSSTAVAA